MKQRIIDFVTIFALAITGGVGLHLILPTPATAQPPENAAPAPPARDVLTPQAALNQRTFTPSKARVITPGAGALSPRPRELFITVAGNITIENEDATTTGSIAVPVGRINLQPYKITAATATVVGFYDQ